MKKVALLLVLGLFGVGCNRQDATTTTAPIPPQTTGTAATTTWQTYTDIVRGFSIGYPSDHAVDLGNGTPLVLPPAVGNKERMVSIQVGATWKMRLDSDGCLVTSQKPVEKEKRIINGLPFCITVTDEGAAGSTYRTYDFVSTLQQVIDTQFVIRFPTSVRIYQGCEQDVDQTKPACLDLAFQEDRDAALFDKIMATFHKTDMQNGTVLK